jgi:maltose alpha-D-glucosyltransferase/alpha-amylase
MDPVYGYQAVNVEAQQRSETSLLHWLRHCMAIRKQWPAFGEGDFEVLNPATPSVFAFLRTLDKAVILCVNNLSRYPQAVQLDLSRFAGRTPVELLGKVRFPAIGELSYLLTLGPHDFYWFSLESTA